MPEVGEMLMTHSTSSTTYFNFFTNGVASPGPSTVTTALLKRVGSGLVNLTKTLLDVFTFNFLSTYPLKT